MGPRPEPFPVELFREILSVVSPVDGRATSSATIVDEIDGDTGEIFDAIEDLVRFGELEFVKTSESGMHVRVRRHRPRETGDDESETAKDDFEYFWLAYIVDANNPRLRRARRLYDNRDDAHKHLERIGHATTLQPVPDLNTVWYEYLGDWNDEYAVLRKEPIFYDYEDPWA